MPRTSPPPRPLRAPRCAAHRRRLRALPLRGRPPPAGRPLSYDLEFAGLKNENDVFQSTSEKTNASGRIETVVRRGAVATSRL